MVQFVNLCYRGSLKLKTQRLFFQTIKKQFLIVSILLIILLSSLNTPQVLNSVNLDNYNRKLPSLSNPIQSLNNGSRQYLDLTPPAVSRIRLEPQEGLITSIDHVAVILEGVVDFESGIAEVWCQYSLEGNVWQIVEGNRLTDSKSSYYCILPPQEVGTIVYYRVLVFDNAGNKIQIPKEDGFQYTVGSSSQVSNPIIEDVLISPTSSVVSGGQLAVAAVVSSVTNPESAQVEVRYSATPADTESWKYQQLLPIAISNTWEELDSGVIYASSFNVTAAPGTSLSLAVGFRDMWGQWVEDTNHQQFYTISVVTNPQDDNEAPLIQCKFMSQKNPTTQDYLLLVLGISDDITNRVVYQTLPTSGVEVSVNNAPYVSLFHPEYPMLYNLPAIVPGYFYNLDTGPIRVMVVRCRAFSPGDSISIKQTFVDLEGSSVTDVTSFTIQTPSEVDTNNPEELSLQIDQAREEVPTNLVWGMIDYQSGLDYYGGCWLEYSLDGDSDFSNGLDDGKVPFSPFLPIKIPASPGGVERIYYQLKASDRAGNTYSTGKRFINVQPFTDIDVPTLEQVYLAEGLDFPENWYFDLIVKAWDDSGIKRLIVDYTIDSAIFKTIVNTSNLVELSNNRFLLKCRIPESIDSPIQFRITAIDYFDKESTLLTSFYSLYAANKPNLALSEITIVPDQPYEYEPVVITGSLSSQLGMSMFGYSVGVLWHNITDGNSARYPLYTLHFDENSQNVTLETIFPGFSQNSQVKVTIHIRSIEGEQISYDLGSITIFGEIPPKVSILTPKEGETVYDSSLITIRIAASDTDEGVDFVQYKIDNSEWVDITDSQSNGIYISIWDPKDQEGIHTLYAKVQDGQGIVSETLTIFQVKKTLGAFLLIDNDQGSLEELPYIKAFNQMGIGYDIWLVNTSGIPNSATLLMYPTIIWIFGNDSQFMIPSDLFRELEHF
ncbi:MAG: Ig-like domain-containing protein, partial [Candidatus Hodarchaeota archaeon]